MFLWLRPAGGDSGLSGSAGLSGRVPNLAAIYSENLFQPPQKSPTIDVKSMVFNCQFDAQVGQTSEFPITRCDLGVQKSPKMVGHRGSFWPIVGRDSAILCIFGLRHGAMAIWLSRPAIGQNDQEIIKSCPVISPNRLKINKFKGM